ncbi:MAG: PQQ-like beta-propeller repeat protein [Planctomycetes bacterium]|nr:PQQ-like beta-propeller repeat protein [Planctomycetota bacterium]
MPRNSRLDRKTTQHLFAIVAVLFVATALQDTVRADDWPQWRGPTRDGVWHETGVLGRFPAKQIKLRWQVEISSGYSGPTVAAGRVYVTDRLVDEEGDKAKQIERVHCFDWRTGKRLWRHTYDCPYVDVSYQAGPRAAVLIDSSRAYSLGTMGHLFCFNAATGEVLWKRDLRADYKIRMPIWGIAASPLMYEDLLIVQIGGAGGACLVAFDKVSGKERWRALNDRASYAAPLIVKQAGQDVLVCWTGDSVVGLAPKTGKTHWSYPFKPRKMVLAVSTPVVHDSWLFITGFYDGSLMLRLGQEKLTAEKVWRISGRDERNTKALHSIISTPHLAGDYVYGVDSYGELRCLESRTGKRIWEDLTATPKSRWGTIHTVRNGNRVFMFNDRGELIIARLSPRGFDEISRAQLISPTRVQLSRRDGVCWSHPAYAYKHVFARNDKMLVCADLSADE